MIFPLLITPRYRVRMIFKIIPPSRGKSGSRFTIPTDRFANIKKFFLLNKTNTANTKKFSKGPDAHTARDFFVSAVFLILRLIPRTPKHISSGRIPVIKQRSK